MKRGILYTLVIVILTVIITSVTRPLWQPMQDALDYKAPSPDSSNVIELNISGDGNKIIISQ